jgi:hypothetical protein
MVKNQIKDLGFDPAQLVGIAAALTSKFTLVPKALGLEEDEDGNELELELKEDGEVSVSKPMSKRKMVNAKGMSSKTARLIEQRQKDAEELAEISPREHEEIINEWGMSNGTQENIPLDLTAGELELDPELISVVADIDGIGTDHNVADIPFPGAEVRQQALLARAQAAKSDHSKFRVKRADS